MDFPDAPYLYRQDNPTAAPARPISQGDVFVGVPLAGVATADRRLAGGWNGRAQPGIGLLGTHPCASRSCHTVETELWEGWVNARCTEEGFQAWLDQPFGGQPIEDTNGIVIPGSEHPTGETRREVLGAYGDAVRTELERTLAE